MVNKAQPPVVEVEKADHVPSRGFDKKGRTPLLFAKLSDALPSNWSRSITRSFDIKNTTYYEICHRPPIEPTTPNARHNVWTSSSPELSFDLLSQEGELENLISIEAKPNLQRISWSFITDIRIFHSKGTWFFQIFICSDLGFRHSDCFHRIDEKSLPSLFVIFKI